VINQETIEEVLLDLWEDEGVQKKKEEVFNLIEQARSTTEDLNILQEAIIFCLDFMLEKGLVRGITEARSVA
jgi:hypothetical protein